MKNKAFHAVAALALLGILIGVPARAQSPKDDRAAEKAAVEQVFRDFVAAYVEGDPKKTATYYNEPLMLVGVGKVFATRAEQQKMVAEARADLLARGYAEFVLDQLAVKLVGKNVALLSYSGERRKKDSTLLEKAAGSFFLRKTDAGWKIATVLAYPPDDFIKLD